jgi:hypothetical protein
LDDDAGVSRLTKDEQTKKRKIRWN